MPFLDRLEARLGRFAIPGLLTAIAVLQIFAFVILTTLPKEAQQAYLSFLMLKPDLVLQGEVWRLISYIFIPDRSLFVVLIGAMFMMWVGRGLEEAWGIFRVNLYVIGGIVSLAAGSLIFGFDPQLEIMSSRGSAIWLYLTALFAFATLFPNEEVLLFFILPVKVKWLALFSAALVGLAIIEDPFAIIVALFALLNYGVAFVPGFVKGQMHQARVASRRAQFEQAATPAAAYFHKCKVCGKTDVDDPKLDFRVTDAGDEICSTCRKSA